MSAQSNRSIPTAAEIEILRILWAAPDSSTREIHELVRRSRTRVVTTTANILEIMSKKQLVRRDESECPYRYQANVKPIVVKEIVIAKLLEALFENRIPELIRFCVESRMISIADMRFVLEQYAMLRTRQGGDKL